MAPRGRALLNRLADPRIALAVAVVGIAAALGGYAWATGFGHAWNPLASGAVDPATSVPANLTDATRDSDRDGIPDLLENYLYGTDPLQWDSRGDGIPDGWLVLHGYDPLGTNGAVALASAPGPLETPAAYGPRGLPDEYRLTLREAYAFKRPAEWDEATEGPWKGGLDPLNWNTSGTGIPDGWLLRYGIDPTLPGLATLRLPGDDLTLLEKYRTGTIPGVADSDGDGIPDDEERASVPPTDPAKFSTSGSGIADGWLRVFSLDPLDPDVAFQDSDNDGLTNLEEYLWSHQRYGNGTLVRGTGLNPLQWNTGESGIPDGWLVKYGLNPLEDGVAAKVLTPAASAWPGVRDLAPHGEMAAIPDLNVTVRDAYTYGRPRAWAESRDGVWWGGTDPTALDSDGDGIPDAVEMRGWYINVTYDVGPRAKAQTIVVNSSAVAVDSDGDGLGDFAEYAGHATEGTVERFFSPTDPKNRDTAFSGISDHEKLFAYTLHGVPYPVAYVLDGVTRGLDPTRADSANRSMKDGDAYRYWHNRSLAVPTETSYPYESLTKRSLDFAATVPGAAKLPAATPEALATLFTPPGDLDGDGIPNVFDADSDGDGLPDGLEQDPALYAKSDFSTDLPRSATDPANPDTDGDGLLDGWEVRSARPVINGAFWNLDPARPSSFRDGILDGDRVLDGDRFGWVSYTRQGTTLVRVEHVVNFNVREHFQYYNLTGIYLDPNELSTAGDGVSDGWKVFWLRTYPDKVTAASTGSSGAGELGEVAPTKSAVDAHALRRATDATASVGDILLASHPYTRFMRTPTATAPTLGPGESAATPVRVDGQFVHAITGTFRYTVRDAYNTSRDAGSGEARPGLNPYLQDTDGDLTPDAWELFFQGAAGPFPTVPDGDADADNDGIPNLAEYNTGDRTRNAFGSDPTVEDTDFGGELDFAEFSRGGNLLSPADDKLAGDTFPDTDGDGVSDVHEIPGWGGPGKGGYFPDTVRTDASNPDSDGDGLLDGTHLCPATPTFETACTPLAYSRAATQAFLALGIAHTLTPDGFYRFLGEVGSLEGGVSTSPRVFDTFTDGIPDGWRTYYGYGAGVPEQGSTYRSYRPAWWTEAQHGVWWWGPSPLGAPNAVNADRVPAWDLDLDGLNDANGEDPFPAANHANRFLGHTDPEAAAAHLRGLPDSEQRLAAQQWGEGAGDPLGTRLRLHACAPAMRARCDLDGDSIPDRLEGAATTLVGVTLEAPSAGGRYLVSKSGTYNVTGRLVLASDPTVPVPNATVLVSLFENSPDTLVGAGFTGPDGTFRITFHLRPAHEATLPAPGTLLLGKTQGTVTWTTPANVVSLGTSTITRQGIQLGNALKVWAYNTSATFTSGPLAYNFTVAGKHLNAIAGPAPHTLNLTVASATTLVLENPPANIGKGEPLTGVVRLLDAAGAPIPSEPVTLRWTGDAAGTRTQLVYLDAQGRLDLATLEDRFLANPATPGTYTLNLTYSPSGSTTQPTARDVQVRVRFPTALTASALSAQATTGGIATLEGNLRETLSGAARPGVLHFSLGGVTYNTTARAGDGYFLAQLPVPADLASGVQAVVITFLGDDRYQPATTRVNLTLLGTTLVSDLRSARVAQGMNATVQGRLLDNTGAPVPRAPIRITLGDASPLTFHTGDDGRFAASLRFDARPGPLDVVVTYLGGGTLLGTSNRTSFIVTTTPVLALQVPPAGIARLSSFRVEGTLTDANGETLAGRPVVVTLGTASTVITDHLGRFTATFYIPSTTRLGLLPYTATYAGTPDGVYGAASAQRAVLVQAQSTLTLGVGVLAPGEAGQPITGRLRDDALDPIAGQPIVITMGRHTVTARTDGTGTFSAHLPLPLTEPVGAYDLVAEFRGTERYAPARAASYGYVMDNTTLTVTAPPFIVRHENFTVSGTLASANTGAPLSGEIVFLIGDRKLGTAKAVDGVYTAVLRAGEKVPIGMGTLKVEFNWQAFHLASTTSVPVLVKARANLTVAMPDAGTLTQGEPFEAVITLLDDAGNPLKDAPVVYQVNDQTPILVRTGNDGKARMRGVVPASGSFTPQVTVRYHGGDTVEGTGNLTFVLRGATVAPAGAFPVALTAMGVLLLAAATGLGVLWYRRRALQDVRRILDLGIQQLAAGNEYTATIFLTYKALAKTLTRYGVLHESSDTPQDLGRAFKTVAPASAPHLDAFITVFERARYSEHPVGPKDRDAAIQAFRAVQRAIDQSPAQPLPEGTP